MTNLKEYTHGPCPAFNACKDRGCPEPVFCMIDRALAATGGEVVVIDKRYTVINEVTHA